jgi:hypothetical protein
MIEKVIPKFVPMYIKKDPVRPHINASVRMAPGREMYHIDEQAFVCLAFLDRVPADEEMQDKQMLVHQCDTSLCQEPF